jgi:hypothetical protein
VGAAGVSARDLARGVGAGRAAIGMALLVAPKTLGRVWLGRTATTPAGAVALRALGVREAIIGMIAVHTVDHPDVGPRWQRTCAVADAVDLAATAAARPGLPRVGSALVMVMAAAGAATGAAAANALSGGDG